MSVEMLPLTAFTLRSTPFKEHSLVHKYYLQIFLYTKTPSKELSFDNILAQESGNNYEKVKSLLISFIYIFLYQYQLELSTF